MALRLHVFVGNFETWKLLLGDFWDTKHGKRSHRGWQTVVRTVLGVPWKHPKNINCWPTTSTRFRGHISFPQLEVGPAPTQGPPFREHSRHPPRVENPRISDLGQCEHIWFSPKMTEKKPGSTGGFNALRCEALPLDRVKSQFSDLQFG